MDDPFTKITDFDIHLWIILKGYSLKIETGGTLEVTHSPTLGTRLINYKGAFLLLFICIPQRRHPMNQRNKQNFNYNPPRKLSSFTPNPYQSNSRHTYVVILKSNLTGVVFELGLYYLEPLEKCCLNCYYIFQTHQSLSEQEEDEILKLLLTGEVGL